MSFFPQSATVTIQKKNVFPQFPFSCNKFDFVTSILTLDCEPMYAPLMLEISIMLAVTFSVMQLTCLLKEQCASLSLTPLFVQNSKVYNQIPLKKPAAPKDP